MQAFSVGLAAYSINAALSFSGTVCISLHHVNPDLKLPGLIYGTFLRSFMAAFRVFVRRIFFPISSWVLQIFRDLFSLFIYYKCIFRQYTTMCGTGLNRWFMLDTPFSCYRLSLKLEPQQRVVLT